FYKSDPVKWKETLVSEIGLVIAYSKMYSPLNDIRKTLNELDDLLLNDTSTVSRIKRINYLRSSAQISLDVADDNALMESVLRIDSICNSLLSEKVAFSAEEKKSMLASIVDSKLLLGNAALKKNYIVEAREYYESGLSQLSDLDMIDTELGKLRCRLHYQLAKLPSMTRLEAAQHAAEAVRWSGRLLRFYFFELAECVLHASDYPEVILDFCETFVSALEPRNQSILPQYLMEASNREINVIDVISEFSKVLIALNTERANTALHNLLQALSSAFDFILRRRAIHNDAIELIDKLAFQLNELSIILGEAGISMDDFSGLAKAQNAYSGVFLNDDSSMNAE
ncbi:MAG: hypothetical protein K2Q15_14775, partial [Burkholderiales bacterium]|nr:hypothetical protein [Burkholderiales bacterium]